MKDLTQHIAVLYLDFHIPEAQSLKDKRQVLKSIKDKVRREFNVSVAELDGQDKWQVGTLAFAMIGNDGRYIDSCLQNIVSLVERNDGIQICEQRLEIL
ncbi:MAG: hypothetical protein A2Z88_10600 [Omnitrophica WOR_2 bacterium GWA2_47_8]|nr:MAG: hypothetical protein A2Z88_10600 [Omnitrophica WOR_2 bacterium GWA2_47_8]